MILLAYSDLLDAKCEALVNTVNCVGVMGKGIALAFKQKFPQNYFLYRQACQNGLVQTGKMFVTEPNTGIPKFIVNFPTKQDWRNPSRIEWISAGLVDLVSFVKEKNVSTIAIPALGCSNGKLDWNIVRPLIMDAFADVQTQVFLFPPK